MGKLWEWIKYSYNKLTTRNPQKEEMKDYFQKDSREGSQELPFWNLYKLKPGETYSEHLNNFNWIHYFLKYKIIIPILSFFRIIARDRLISERDLPDEEYNKLLKIFGESWEEAIKEWNLGYRRLKYSEGEKSSWNFWKKKIHDNSSEHLRIIKDLWMTTAAEDSVYRDFTIIFNVLLARNVLAYARDHGGEIHHLFFPDSDRADDELAYQWYKLYPVVQNIGERENKGFQVEPVQVSPEGEEEFNKKLDGMKSEIAKEFMKGDKE